MAVVLLGGMAGCTKDPATSANGRPLSSPPEGLPACEYADQDAQRVGYEDWQSTLVDTIARLGKTTSLPTWCR
jgi:hypothetical protein